MDWWLQLVILVLGTAVALLSKVSTQPWYWTRRKAAIDLGFYSLPLVLTWVIWLTSK